MPLLKKEPIAIVGIGCRFPGGVASPEEFWNLLANGLDAITGIPADRFDIDSFYDPDFNKPGKIHVQKGGFIQEIDKFDPHFFGISPKEASRMDPQQRLLLEVTYYALEDAGIRMEDLSGTSTGVFIGLFTHDFENIHLAPSERLYIGANSATGISTTIASNRISYVFNLKGPSFTLDTACSSSLTAAHLACQSIWLGESEYALAGGVNAILGPQFHLLTSKGGFLSPDGRCKSFDSRANGYVRSEGAGVLLLKPLSKAKADGDNIYALIIGSAINQDGQTNGITVPSEASQKSMLQSAYRDAGIPPAYAQYIEAHGTGTKTGDPVEAGALGSVVGYGSGRKDICLIGSVKSNIGHTEAASGAAGLIKLALCLKKNKIPKNLHFLHPNPDIPFADLQLKVVTHLQDWPQNGNKKYGGVNSFGFGGSNAHLVLTEYIAENEKKEYIKPSGPCIFAISAGNPQTLKALSLKYSNFLDTNDNLDLKNICHSAARGRSALEHRLAIVAGEKAELIEILKTFQKNEVSSGLFSASSKIANSSRLVFVMSGQGPQWWAMGRQLLQEEAVFRDTVQNIDKLLSRHTGWSLLAELSKNEAKSLIHETDRAQPALFALHLGIAELLKSWGIEPAAIIGHSIGEVSAAYFSQALSLEDAVRVIYHRSRVHAGCKGVGKMLFAALTEDEARKTIHGYEDRVDISTINGPTKLTIAGESKALEEISQKLTQKDIYNTFVRVDIPFHSKYMEPLQIELLEALDGIKPQREKYPLYSTVTADRISGEKLIAGYWYENVRQPVRFYEGIKKVLHDGYNIFVEISPHPILSSSIEETMAVLDIKGMVLPTLKRNSKEKNAMLGIPAALYASGYTIAWEKIYRDCGKKFSVQLPLYPFQREKYWLESEESRFSRLGIQAHPLLGSVSSSVAEPDNHIWQIKLDTRIDSYLNHHKVQDIPVFPGAGHIELAIAIGEKSFKRDFGFLEEINFISPLFLPELGEPPKVQLEIFSDEGNYHIYTQGEGPEASWIKHSEGKINHIGDKFFSRPVDFADVRKRINLSVPVQELYDKLQQSGLQYGPSFQCINRLWRGTDEVLAEIYPYPGAIFNYEKYFLHPTMLDGCFQTIFGLFFDPENAEKIPVYLPVHIDKIKFHLKPGYKIWSFGRIFGRTDKHLFADFWLIADNGECVAEVHGCIFRYVEGSKGETASKIDDFFYENRWENKLRKEQELNRYPEQFLPALGSIQDEMSAFIGELSERPETGKFQNIIEPFFNELCINYVFHALKGLGFNWAVQKEFSVEYLMEQCKISPRLGAYFRRLLNLLYEFGYLEKTTGGWKIIRENVLTEPDIKKIQLAGNVPEFFIEYRLLERVGPQIRDVLRGNLDPLQVIFAEDEWETMIQYYTSSFSFKRYNEITHKALSKLLSELPSHRTLRILEIGAGTGGLSQSIFPILPQERSQYLFTDLSQIFFQNAKKRFQKYPFIQYQILDIEKNPWHQGFDAYSFDLVIASNVIHAARDLRSAITNIQKVLAYNGILVMLEVTKLPVYTDILFGMLEGWWLFKDHEIRADQAFLSREKWETLLSEHHFTDILSLTDTEKNGLTGQTLFLARNQFKDSTKNIPVEKTAMKQRGIWLIVSGNAAFSAKLKKGFQVRKQKCIEIDISGMMYAIENNENFSNANSWEQENWAHNLNFALIKEKVISGVIFIPDSFSTNIQQVAVEILEKIQIRNCLTLLAILKSTLKISQQNKPLICMVTQGSQKVVAGDQALFIENSSLWGLGRVIANEYPDLPLKLIDLSGEAKTAELDNLVKELLLFGNQEKAEEIALREETRFIRKLQRISPLAFEKNFQKKISVLGGEFRLEQRETGDLDKFCFRRNDRKKIMDFEIEIQVFAAGLNYKDLRIATGLYTGQDFDEKERGAKFGGECAGIISALGRKVSKFKVGDQVLAFASESFAGFTVTRENLAVHKPEYLSFEKAAAIPIAFLTAYYSLIFMGQLKEGEWILIHSAAWSVGVAAIKLAKRQGANIIASAMDSKRMERLKSMGVKYVLDAASADFVSSIKKITKGKGVDIVLNSLSGKAVTQSIKCLAPFGRFIEIGKQMNFVNLNLGRQNLSNNFSYYLIDIGRILTQRDQLAGALFSSLMEHFKSRELDPPMIQSFPVSKISEAFKFMTEETRIEKIVITMQKDDIISLAPRSEISFKKDALYLITGGTSGFGLAVANWLAEKGARNLILMSRSGPKTEQDLNAIQDMRNRGINVIISRADVSKKEEIAKALSEIEISLPPLKGIIHSAIVYDDALLDAMDEKNLTNVMKPKMSGAWNLHLISLDKELDFFMLFSSVSSLYGNPGQGSYSAFNSFLDSLSFYRRNQGLPSTTVNWGVLSDVGFVSRNRGTEKRLENQGWTSLSLKEIFLLLEKIFLYDPVQIAAVNANWENFGKFFPHLEDSLRFSHLIHEKESLANDLSDKGKNEPLKKKLLKSDLAESELLLQSSLRDAVARIVGYTSEKINLNESIASLGIDSLMANQLRGWIKSNLDLDYSLMKLMQGPSVAEISQSLIKDFKSKADKITVGEPIKIDRKNSWIICRKPNPEAKIRLYCLPYMAGGASIYNSWSNILPDDMEVCALQLPGREERMAEKSIEDIWDLLKALAEIILRQKDRPFAVYGHSYGAAIGYELIRYLSDKHNLLPLHFFAGGAPAPHLRKVFGVRIEDMKKSENSDLSHDFIINFLRQYNIPEEVLSDHSLMKEITPSVKADIRILAQYIAGNSIIRKPLDCNITLYMGKDDFHFNTLDASEWQKHTAKKFQILEIPGGHLFLIDEDNRKTLLKNIERELRKTN